MRFLVNIFGIILLASCQSTELLKNNPLIKISESSCVGVVEVVKFKSTINNHGNEENEQPYTFYIADDFLRSNSSLSIPSLNIFEYRSKEFIVVFKDEKSAGIDSEYFNDWAKFKSYISDNFDYSIYYNLNQFIPERIKDNDKLFKVFHRKSMTYFVLNFNKKDEIEILKSFDCK